MRAPRRSYTHTRSDEAIVFELLPAVQRRSVHLERGRPHTGREHLRPESWATQLEAYRSDPDGMRGGELEEWS